MQIDTITMHRDTHTLSHIHSATTNTSAHSAYCVTHNYYTTSSLFDGAHLWIIITIIILNKKKIFIRFGAMGPFVNRFYDILIIIIRYRVESNNEM